MGTRRSADRLNGGLLVGAAPPIEIERRAVDAKAQALGPRAVREDVAKMAVAAGAANLRSNHSVGAVLMEGHFLGIGRLGEARPAAAAVELGPAVEQKLAAAGAAIPARFVIVPIEAGESALGAALAKHLILIGGKALAPLLVGHVLRVHGRDVGLRAKPVNAKGALEVVWRDFAGRGC